MVQAILTDIEGTTSSIHFVKSVLFPYAAQAIPGFLRSHAADPKISTLIQAAAQEADLDPNNLDAVIQQLLDWIEGDRKSTALKAIQGLVWEQGYTEGSYQAHIYPDAHEVLQAWHRQGISLYVYSSGSIWAQKLFFGYSEFGDLTGLFQGYFDTTIGPKKEVDSYQKIREAIALPSPQNILFLSDILEELDAAKAAGYQTCWLVRPEDTTATAEEIAAAGHRIATDFYQVCLEGTWHLN